VDSKTKPVFTKHGKILATAGKKRQSHVMSLMDNQMNDGARVYTYASRIYDWMDKTGSTTRRVTARVRSWPAVFAPNDRKVFWSLVNCGMAGTHHAVSQKGLRGYVKEYVWQCNHRVDGREMFSALLLRSALPDFGH
jgi:ISXO2-like transposase domain